MSSEPQIVSNIINNNVIGTNNVNAAGNFGDFSIKIGSSPIPHNMQKPTSVIQNQINTVNIGNSNQFILPHLEGINVRFDEDLENNLRKTENSVNVTDHSFELQNENDHDSSIEIDSGSGDKFEITSDDYGQPYSSKHITLGKFLKKDHSLTQQELDDNNVTFEYLKDIGYTAQYLKENYGITAEYLKKFGYTEIQCIELGFKYDELCQAGYDQMTILKAEINNDINKNRQYLKGKFKDQLSKGNSNDQEGEKKQISDKLSILDTDSQFSLETLKPLLNNTAESADVQKSLLDWINDLFKELLTLFKHNSDSNNISDIYMNYKMRDLYDKCIMNKLIETENLSEITKNDFPGFGRSVAKEVIDSTLHFVNGLYSSNMSQEVAGNLCITIVTMLLLAHGHELPNVSRTDILNSELDYVKLLNNLKTEILPSQAKLDSLLQNPALKDKENTYNLLTDVTCFKDILTVSDFKKESYSLHIDDTLEQTVSGELQEQNSLEDYSDMPSNNINQLE